MKKIIEISLTASLISISFKTVLFVTKMHQSFWLNSIIYVFVIWGMYKLLKFYSNNNNQVSFSDNFKQTFLFSLIVGVFYRLFCFFYLEYIDIYLARELLSRTNLSNQEVLVRGLLSFIFVCTIFSFIISSIFKKEPY